MGQVTYKVQCLFGIMRIGSMDGVVHESSPYTTTAELLKDNEWGEIPAK